GGGSGALQLGTLQERDPSRRHHGRSARSLADPVQPHFLVDFAAFGPALVHFDVQEQVHRHAEHLGQFFACRLADRLDPRASLTEHDRLLAVAADDDLLVDLDAAVLAGLVALGTYRAIVRQLVVELAVELLAGDFGGEQALARVADLVFWIVPRAFGHQAGEVRFQLRHTVAGQGRDEEHFGESGLTGELLRQGEQRFLLAGIDLVEREQLAFRPVLQRFQQRFELVPALLDRIDHQNDRIGAVRAFPGRLDHRPVEPALGFEDAGRIDEDDLRLAMQRDAEQPGAGGLRLGAGDRHLLADELVDQRRLARIGRANHRDETATRLGQPNFSMNNRAASVSASCLLPAVASTSPTFLTLTRTVNRAA